MIMNKFVVCLLIAFSILGCSDNSNNKEDKQKELENTKAQIRRNFETEIGKYVYVDGNRCLHTDRSCMRLRVKNYYIKCFKPDGVVGYYEYTCALCVSDEDAKRLCEMSRQEIQKNNDSTNLFP